MLIGESGAGKTSLKRTLKGEKFNNQEPSTQGIEVDPPLVKAGIKPWQDNEKKTVFDHKSALLVARQLSVETPTQPSPPVVRANKSPQSANVEGSEEIFHFKPAVDLSSHRAKGNFDGTLISFHPDFTLDKILVIFVSVLIACFASYWTIENGGKKNVMSVSWYSAWTTVVHYFSRFTL